MCNTYREDKNMVMFTISSKVIDAVQNQCHTEMTKLIEYEAQNLQS